MNQNLQDFFLGCKECVLENPRSFYGNFTLGPFKNSQSLTIANALRRTLLTEISNIAITHVEIDGVFHEYSTIEGVRESVLDILLNFKQIVLKTSLPLAKPIYGYLNVRGPGIVRVADLKLPPHIQYVDPDQYIATLNENGKLSLKLTISDFSNSLKEKTENTAGKPSFGELSFAEKIQSNQPSLSKIETQKSKESEKRKNSLWVDPNFNPILKVNYLIENLEPIGRFQNQLVHIEIWTNGSIHPRKALYLTFDFLRNIFHKFSDMKYMNSKFNSQFFQSEKNFVKILKSYEYDFGFYEILSLKNIKKFSGFGPLLEFEKNVLGQVESFPDNFDSLNKVSQNSSSSEIVNSEKNDFSHNSTKDKNRIQKDNEIFQKKILSVEKLNLPFRITQCLIQNNLFTIADLLNYSPKELQNFCGIGNFSLSLIQKKLKKHGFFLKGEKEI
jgi:DNA-directed RNA polymerase subunit alpha